MQQLKTVIGKGGRLVIPAGYRRALGLEAGDEVVLVLGEGEVRLFTPQGAVRQARALVRRYVSPDRRLSEELIRERREEAAGV